MRKKNILILCLISTATAMFCAIQFGIIPYARAQEAEYIEKQQTALTHDISSITEFKNPYVGDASNIGHLFLTLPLNQIPMRFEIDSDACALTVYYLDTVWNIGVEEVRRDLLYNAAAAMAVIDNLTAVTFNFSGASYTFDRGMLEDTFGAPLSDLLEPNTWEKTVRGPLFSTEFVASFFS